MLPIIYHGAIYTIRTTLQIDHVAEVGALSINLHLNPNGFDSLRQVDIYGLPQCLIGLVSVSPLDKFRMLERSILFMLVGVILRFRSNLHLLNLLQGLILGLSRRFEYFDHILNKLYFKLNQL